MIRIALIGDVMLGRLVDEYLQSHPDPSYVWGDTLDLIRDCSLAICNAECVIADSGAAWQENAKAFHFRSRAKNVEVLTCAGIDAVTMANNHSFDFGETALAEMISTLDKAHIGHAGAGMNSVEAMQPAILMINQTRFALLSFTDDMPEWEATNDQAGIYYVALNPSSASWKGLLKKVEEAKAASDRLVVSPHWGSNWGYEMKPIYTEWAHRLIDAGADAIFGHSGHVPRGIEIYKGKPIIYSAGDFIDDYAISDDEPNDVGFVYILEIEDGQPAELKLHPTVIKNFQARLAGTRAPRIAEDLIGLSKRLGTTSIFDPQAHVVTIPIRGRRR